MIDYHIALSHQAKKSIQSAIISEETLLDVLDRFIDYIKKGQKNPNIIKLHGEWKDYHRIRIGDIRIVIQYDMEKNYLYVKRIGHRGDVYK